MDKLVSLYSMKREQNADIIKKNAGHFPTWEKFITSLINDDEFVGCEGCGREISNDWRGLADSVVFKCQPCHFHYDAVIKMETFDDDSR